MKVNCECTDPGCPACRGKCDKRATMCLLRVDMEDRTGVLFCDKCGSDAMESGVFSDHNVRAWIRATTR